MVELTYDVYGPSLEEQANEQGYTFGKEAEYYEDMKVSVLKIWIHGYATDSQTKEMLQKLNKRALRQLKEMK